MDDLAARAPFRTKAEVGHMVASMRPRTAPQDGIRKPPEWSAMRKPPEAMVPLPRGDEGGAA
jgi:hypothetical protein